MLVIAIAPILWAKGAIALVAFAATLPAVRVLAGPLKRMLTEEPQVDPALLINTTGWTDVGEVRPNFGRALIKFEEREHVVEVRCREGSITPRGTEVLFVEYNADENFFWVEKT